MKRPVVWMVSIPMFGHIAPLASVAHELEELGYECVMVSTDTGAALLPASVRFLSTGLNYCTAEEDAERLSKFFTPAGTVFEQIKAFTDHFCGMERNMCTGLWRLLGPDSLEPRPDLIVSDAMTMAGFDAAEHFGIPAVGAFQSPLSGVLEFMGQNRYNLVAGLPVEQLQCVFSTNMTWFQRWVLSPLLKRLLVLPMSYLGTPRRDLVRAEFGLPRLANRTLFAPPVLDKGFMMLVGTTWEMERERQLPPNWHLCGPLSADFTQPAPAVEEPVCRRWCDDALAAGRPLILVAFGTLVCPSPAQVRELVATMEQLPQLSFLWGLHPECLAAAGDTPLPSNVLRQPRVPQVAVLFHPACRLFVTHCGMSSAHEGAAAGKLLVGTPFGADQFINAQHVVDQGRGLQVKPVHFQAAHLVSAIQACLASPAMQAACDKTARAICAQSGPRTGALLIDDFVKGLAPCDGRSDEGITLPE